MGSSGLVFASHDTLTHWHLLQALHCGHTGPVTHGFTPFDALTPTNTGAHRGTELSPRKELERNLLRQDDGTDQVWGMARQLH